MQLSLIPTIRKLFGRTTAEVPEPLPVQAVIGDGVDSFRFNSYKMDAPRFARTIDEAPVVAPKAVEPEPIDFATASPEEIKQWQEEVKEARRAREQAEPYDFWENLARDIFTAYHHSSPPEIRDVNEMDPATRFHSKIVRTWMTDEAFTRTRNYTRDDAVLSAQALIHGAPLLQEKLEHELIQQVQQSEEIERTRQKAEHAMSELESLREEARQYHADGEPVPQDLVDQIKAAVQNKRQLQEKAAQLAEDAPVPLTMAAFDAIREIVQSVEGHVEECARHGAPGFGQGLGNDEPRYESPEQALSIAEKWANDPTLKQIAEMYGKFDPHMRFLRAKRIEGGQDEIVDIVLGDDLKRVTPGELAVLADDDTEDDFYSRYLSGEIAVFSTVGEEHAGRGPMILVLDGSHSMSTGTPTRNASCRAMALAVLNIARHEKRDCAVVEFASINQLAFWEFPAHKPLDAEQIVDMAAHFFAGMTHPLQGIAKGLEIMESSPKFRNADLVIISDGEVACGAEDKRIRDELREKGVRIHGIAVGASRFRYLEEMCDPESLIGIHDMDLGDPNAASAYLATHLT